MIKDKPGNCPICSMALVKKSDMKQGGMHQMHVSTGMKQHRMMGDSTHMKKGMMQNNKEMKMNKSMN